MWWKLPVPQATLRSVYNTGVKQTREIGRFRCFVPWQRGNRRTTELRNALWRQERLNVFKSRRTQIGGGRELLNTHYWHYRHNIQYKKSDGMGVCAGRNTQIHHTDSGKQFVWRDKLRYHTTELEYNIHRQKILHFVWKNLLDSKSKLIPCATRKYFACLLISRGRSSQAENKSKQKQDLF